MDDLEHVFEREGLEVEPVGGVVVGRYRLGVAVDHDGLEAGIRQREGGVHAGVVELDALPDPIRPGTQDDDLAAVAGHHLGLLVVARVVIRGQGRKLARAGVDGLEHGAHVERPADVAHLGLVDATQLPDLRVAEPVILGEPEDVCVERRGGGDLARDLVDQLDLVDEPRVDAGRLEYFGVAGTGSKCLLHSDDAAIRRHFGDLQQFGERAQFFAPVETRSTLLERPQSFLQRRRVVAADRHRLADRFHGRGEPRIRRRELLESESRHFHHDIVERRLEARGRDLGDVVRDLVEAVADRQFRGDLGNREAGSFRRQCTRARDSGVHLDHDHAAVRRVDRELDVAAPGVDADGPDDVDADVADVLILAIGEGECGSDRDRITRVHADRVDVLDRTHDDRIVGGVAHELEFVFLPSEDRLFEQHLARGALMEPIPHHSDQLVTGVRETTAETAHGERRSDDQGVTEILGEIDRLGNIVRNVAACDIGAAIEHQLLEDLAIFALVDRVEVRADQFDAVFLEDAVFVELDGGVQRRLPTQRREYRIRTLLGDDRLDDFPGDGFDVGGVGEVGVGHDRGRVRVDQDDAHTLLTEHAARLGA